jgi:O-methyltransferase
MALSKAIKMRLATFLARFGYTIYRLEPDGETIRPAANYMPWRDDAAFLEIYAAVVRNTMVDKYRLYELWTLVKQSQKLTGSLLEVGAWRGGSAGVIAASARANGITSPFYVCDTFTGVVKTSEKDGTYRGGEHSDTSRAIVEELLFQKMHLENVKILEGIFPDQTAKGIENDKFRFCHIDVDSYESARDVLNWVWPRLVVGGIVVYDDYGFRSAVGVTRHVEEQLALDDRIGIYNLNGHAVVIKIK